MIVPHSMSQLIEELNALTEAVRGVYTKVEPLRNAWASTAYAGLPDAIGLTMRSKGVPAAEVEEFVNVMSQHITELNHKLLGLSLDASSADARIDLMTQVLIEATSKAKRAQPEVAFRI